MMEREETASLIRLSGSKCAFTFERLQAGVMLVRIMGYDKGELGTAPLDELVVQLGDDRQVELFIDASQAEGIVWSVSQQWADWFHAYQSRLSGVNILVGSRFVQQTILVAKELSRTANLLCVFSDPAPFFARLRIHAPEWDDAM